MRRKRDPGFTLVEMLVVVGVLMVLAALLLPAIAGAVQKGRETQCKSNMRQIYESMVLYQGDYASSGIPFPFPPRMQTLVDEDIIQTADVFLCPLDITGGTEGGKPSECGNQYSETDEVAEGLKHSYMYECSDADCDWAYGYFYGPNTQFGKDNPTPDLANALEHYPNFQRSPGATNPTWGEAKNNQLRYGDEFLWDRTFQSGKGGQIGYDSTKFPILRCFWHTDEPDRQDNLAISNIALDGHHFRSHPKWEWVAVGIPPE